jgi:inorganic pyrophosphatase
MIVTIEIPAGSKYKYEENPVTGELHVDRVLSIRCPANYGFIPGTLSADGDPTDAFVVTEDPLHPGASVLVSPLWKVEMLDGGVEDNKIICGVKGDIDVWEYHVSDILHYLANYKKGIEIKEVTRLKTGCLDNA